MLERTKNRAEIYAKSQYREGFGLALPIEVTNLSELGCGLSNVPRSLAKGKRISLRIGSIGPVYGIIKWCRTGKSAGIQFVEPLHPAVVEHLSTEYASGGRANVEFR